MFGTVISLGILAIMILSIIGALLFGRTNAKFRCASIGCAAVLSFIATIITKSLLKKGELITLIESLIAEFAQLAQAAISMPEVTETILSLVSAMIAPLLFIIFFIVFSIIAFLVSVIVWLIKVITTTEENKRKNSIVTRLVTGVISGLIFIVCIMIPVSSYASVASSALPIIDDPEFEAVGDISTELNNVPTIKVFNTLGGSLLCNTLTNIKFTDGEETITTNLSNEAESVAYLYNNIKKLSGIELSDYSNTEAEIIITIGENLSGSKFITKLSSGIIYYATDAWRKGEPFLGVEKPSAGQTFDPVIDEFFLIAHTDSQNISYLSEDINTIAHLISDFATGGVFAKLESEPKEIITALTENDIILNVIADLNANPRMKRLIPILTNLGFSIIGDSIGIPENAQEVYDGIMSDISDAINNTASYQISDRINTVADTVYASITESGTQITEEDALIIASALVSKFENKQLVKPEEITAFFLSLNEALSEGETADITFSGSFSIAPLGKDSDTDVSVIVAALLNEISAASDLDGEAKAQAIQNALDAFIATGIIDSASSEYKAAFVESVCENALSRSKEDTAKTIENIKALKSGQTASSVITKITLESIFFDPELYTQSTIDSTELNNSMAKLFSNAADIVYKMSESDFDITHMTDHLSDLFDTLAHTSIYGQQKTHHLFSALLHSSAIQDSISLSNDILSSIIDSTKDINDFSSLIEMIGGFSGVIENSGEDNIQTDHIINIIKNTNKETAGVIETIITEETLVDAGIENNNMTQTVDVVQNVFANLAEIEDEETFENEAEAVKSLMELASLDLESKENVFSGDDGIGYTADELVNTIAQSTAVRKTLSDTVSAESQNPFEINLSETDHSDLLAACDSHLQNNPDDTDFINDIKNLFGIA